MIAGKQQSSKWLSYFEVGTQSQGSDYMQIARLPKG
jgi:hypothetical protein